MGRIEPESTVQWSERKNWWSEQESTTTTRRCSFNTKRSVLARNTRWEGRGSVLAVICWWSSMCGPDQFVLVKGLCFYFSFSNRRLEIDWLYFWNHQMVSVLLFYIAHYEVDCWRGVVTIEMEEWGQHLQYIFRFHYSSQGTHQNMLRHVYIEAWLLNFDL